MKFLNLSSGLQFTPAIACESFVFSGGEPHIRLSPLENPQQPVTITVQARTAADFILVLLANDALRRMGCSQIRLFMPYFPAARQDRAMTTGEPLSAKVYAQLLNAAGFDCVTVFDPHSDVAPALLDRCQSVDNFDFVSFVLRQLPDASSHTLISPDAGAARKIGKLADRLGLAKVVQCTKSRDVKTGQLSAPMVFSEDQQGADCLIVDDICDGGGTFIQLARALRAKNAGRLRLCVSHGIFSKGLDPLLEHFDHVFCTNSFYNGPSHPSLTVFDLASA
jgi:ribose-phosphate pyrophosphokinase